MSQLLSAMTAESLAKTIGTTCDDVMTQLRDLGAEITDAAQPLPIDTVRALLGGRNATLPIRRPSAAPPRDSRRTRKSVTPAELPPLSELLFMLREATALGTEPSDEVFIVHGHDDIRHIVAGFVAGLQLKPVMLEQRANRGQTIIEKLERNAAAAFAIILLTPDDEGRKRGGETLHPRARQNVILELGYFLARLGRHRVCALYAPGVELPSDVQGLLYVQLDSSETWKYLLQRELVAAGVPVRVE